MKRILTILALIGFAPALMAEDKATSCGYQADVVAAVQAAHLDRVREASLEAHILDSAPDWPEKYNRVIPLVAPWVYGQTRRDLRANDLGAVWNEMCLQQ